MSLAAAALYALLVASAFTTIYDPLPDLPLAVDLTVLVLPSLGLGLAIGRFSAVALPFLVLAPWAIAGDDGSNAFAYRLPAAALGLLAASAAVLVLTGVLLRTGRRRLPESIGVACVIAGAVPLLWAGYLHLQPLDRRGDLTLDTTFRGVALDTSRARAVELLGPAENGAGESIAPLDEDFDHIGGPPFIGTPGASHETLRYRDTSVLVSDSRVYGLVITDGEAETAEGVGIGDNLGLAEERYGGIECGIARAGEYRTFPYCGGRLDRERWIWFGQDPIRSIVLTTTELGPD